MSSQTEALAARSPKRARGKERVAQLLEAATAVFAQKGYEAATMTEIAARAGAPIGSLYQFFPVKEALADTLVQQYVDCWRLICKHCRHAHGKSVLERSSKGCSAYCAATLRSVQRHCR